MWGIVSPRGHRHFESRPREPCERVVVDLYRSALARPIETEDDPIAVVDERTTTEQDMAVAGLSQIRVEGNEQTGLARERPEWRRLE